MKCLVLAIQSGRGVARCAQTAVLSVLVACTSTLVAQSEAATTHDYGEAYAFDERKPRSRVELLVDGLLPSIVKIHGASGLASIDAFASGVLVSEHGHVLTLDLVMIQRERTRIVLYDGSVHDAQLLGVEERLGLRLLKFDPSGLDVPLKPLWPAVDLKVRGGTFVVSLGNAFRLAEFSEKISAFFGVVVGKVRTGLRYGLADVDYDGELLLTDAANNPGHGGGGLFTLRGDWIGLNAKVMDSKETNTLISAAVPAEELIAFLNEHVRGIRPEVSESDEAATATPGFHGIRLFEHGGRRSPPAYIDRVTKGSPGRELGLRPDDLIVRVGDASIRSCREFTTVMAGHQAGATVKLTWKRGNAIKTGTMTLVDDPTKESK